MKNQELITLEKRINDMLKTINSDKTPDIQKVILSRSLIEQFSILNLLKAKPEFIKDRINIFKAYEYLKVFLQNIAIDIERNPTSGGFATHFNIQDNQQERVHVETLVNDLKRQNRNLDNKINLYIKLLLNLSGNVTDDDYYKFVKELIQNNGYKYPFPYKKIPGVKIENITKLIQKYSQFDKDEIKTRYGILADLSHGVLLNASDVYIKVAKPIVDEISKKINS